MPGTPAMLEFRPGSTSSNFQLQGRSNFDRISTVMLMCLHWEQAGAAWRKSGAAFGRTNYRIKCFFFFFRFAVILWSTGNHVLKCTTNYRINIFLRFRRQLCSNRATLLKKSNFGEFFFQNFEGSPKPVAPQVSTQVRDIHIFVSKHWFFLSSEPRFSYTGRPQRMTFEKAQHGFTVSYCSTEKL